MNSKSTNLNKFLFYSFIFLNPFLSHFARAQEISVAVNLERSDKGGNGGSLSEIDLAGVKNQLERVRIELIEFLDSRSGKEIYSHLNIDETIDVLREANSFEVIYDRLWDKYNIERDALNYPEKLKVFINAKSFVEAVDTKAIWVLVLHEAFGLANIEVNIPGDVENSYKESIKIWRFIGEDKGFRLYTISNGLGDCEMFYFRDKTLYNWNLFYGSEYHISHEYKVTSNWEDVDTLKLDSYRNVERLNAMKDYTRQELQYKRGKKLFAEKKEFAKRLARFEEIISKKCSNAKDLVESIELPKSKFKFVY